MCQIKNLVCAHITKGISLWNTFIQIYESVTSIDIAFDLYILNSNKNEEREIEEGQQAFAQQRKFFRVRWTYFGPLGKTR